jgi:hypothetical protein
MSTTTARGGIDFAEQITRINNLQADTALKLAQAAKNQADTKWAGWQVAFGDRRDCRPDEGAGLMQRISVSLPAPQMSWLQREAKRIGITIGELLRRIIDQVREQEPRR